MFGNANANSFLIKGFAVLCIVLSLLIIAAPYVFAQVSTTQEQQAVSDFATFIINILTGPVSRVIAGILLIGGVLALLNGKHGVAIACGFGFIILMFIPKILQSLFQQ